MGNSNSSLIVAKTIQSLLTDEPINSETKANIFSASLSETDVEQVMPSSVIRIMRHYYTHNFALLLYWCVTEISDMTQYRMLSFDMSNKNDSNTNTTTTTNTNSMTEATKTSSSKAIGDEQRKRFFNALQLLRRLLPFAFESGDTPLLPYERQAIHEAKHSETTTRAEASAEAAATVTSDKDQTFEGHNNNNNNVELNSYKNQDNEQPLHQHNEHSEVNVEKSNITHLTEDKYGNNNNNNNNSSSSAQSYDGKDNADENTKSHSEQGASMVLPSNKTTTTTKDNKTDAKLSNETKHNELVSEKTCHLYEHLIPAHKTRTQATIDFATRFFVNNERCKDDHYNVTFPPLPRYLYRNQEEEQLNSNTQTPNTNVPLSPNVEQGNAITTTVNKNTSNVPTAIGAHLMWALVECCFIPTLTLEMPLSYAMSAHLAQSRSLTHPLVCVNLLWEGGVGQEDPYGLLPTSTSISTLPATQLQQQHEDQHQQQYEQKQKYSSEVVTHSQKKRTSEQVYHARAELLSTLLSALSAILYHPIGSREVIFTEMLISTAVVPRMPTLTLSFLNTLLNYQPYGRLPYTSYFISKEEQVVLYAARVLAVLLCYQGIPLHETTQLITTQSEQTNHLNTALVKGESDQTRVNYNNVDNDNINKKEDDLALSQQNMENITWNNSGNKKVNMIITGKSSNDNSHEQVPITNTTSAAAAAITTHDKEYEGNKQSMTDALKVKEKVEDVTLHTKTNNEVVADVASNMKETSHKTELTNTSGNKQVADTAASTRLPNAKAADTASPTMAPSVEIVHSARKDIFELTLTEAKFVTDKLKSLVRLDMYAQLTYLPDSQHTINVQDEVMMILYKLLELSQAMQVQFANSSHVLEYLVPLLHYGFKAVINTYFVNRLHLTLFILQHLSQVRGFVVQCNKPCKEFYPQPLPHIPANATYNDAIILTLCAVVESEKPALRVLFTLCTVILSNMAPFVTTLTPLTSLHLTMTFASLSLVVLRHAFTVHINNNNNNNNSRDQTSNSILSENTHTVNNNNNSNKTNATQVVDTSMEQSQTPHSDNSHLHLSQEMVDVYKISLTHICEAIASLLQYQQISSHYLILALVEFRQIVQFVCKLQHELNEQFVTTSTKLPFLIDTLNMAITAALPLVERFEVFPYMAINMNANGSNKGDEQIAGTGATQNTVNELFSRV